MLALLPGTNGDRVLLASYHELTAAEMPIGGGEFYYVSSLAGVNNGVTIFNGWCRKIINKTLTTYDAGLKPGDGSNASARLQALADVLRGTSGFTLVGSGTHQVDRPIRFEGASFLKITGDFTVSAAERRDNWQHQGWDNDELPDAVLYFKNCPYLSIPRTVEVVGAKSWYRDYNPAQTYEMGDCGIRLYRCPHSYIEASRSRAKVSATVKTPIPSRRTVNRPQATFPQSVRCAGGLGISRDGVGSLSLSLRLPGLPETTLRWVGFGRRPAIGTSQKKSFHFAVVYKKDGRRSFRFRLLNF